MIGTPFLLHRLEENFVRLLFFFFSFAVWEVNGDWFPVLGTFAFVVLDNHMSPITICPWFGPVNGDVVQLQGKLFILFKMFLVSNVFTIYLWLNILDLIVLVNVYTVDCWNLFCFVELCRHVFLYVFIIYYFTNVYDVHAFFYKSITSLNFLVWFS